MPPTNPPPVCAGISIGASSIKVALITGTTQPGVLSTRSIAHESRPREALEQVMHELRGESIGYGMLTGRDFCTRVSLPFISEPRAFEQALSFLAAGTGLPPQCRALVTLGAENFIVYRLDDSGVITGVETGNKCASGTGSFFLQQLGRMDLDLERAMAMDPAGGQYRVSGRCSVFCKSDCTHALNKGVPIDQVTRGLAAMMADKVLELLEKIPPGTVVLTGGVTRNRLITELLLSHHPSLVIPPHAPCFEALGAAWHAWRTRSTWQHPESLFVQGAPSAFATLPPLSRSAPRVRFEHRERGTPRAGDACLVGLDVGSTTTKAVVMRRSDHAVLASVYLRTNANPVEAARRCYRALNEQLQVPLDLQGVATTGSGRQIAGVHAGTNAIINEIIAHAAGAAFFDPLVDTIYEIGGQDAKYTHLTAGVASDYAMNEACSAGTGSFLEEAARESLGIPCEAIADAALQGDAPPDFSDQCAAFIGSDIATAIHEGIGANNIAAGLVYSICHNYCNRVRGQRPTGTRVFMQGGVCYNRAVPLAMAWFADCDIVVPPDPGLMGAFGVACELHQRLERGAVEERRFSLAQLAGRELHYGKPFICHGGAGGCGRKCEIATIGIGPHRYPFGGACNKYYNRIHHVSFTPEEYDYVERRHRIVYAPASLLPVKPGAVTVGVTRSFLTTTLYPLYARFFTALGAAIVTPHSIDEKGVKRRQTSLCYPAEIAHGYFHNLAALRPDHFFLPKIIEYHVENSVSRRREHQCTCLLLQSEAYLLKAAFHDELRGASLIEPVLDFSQGWGTQEAPFVQAARLLGTGEKRARAAYRDAVRVFTASQEAIRQVGDSFHAFLDEHPERFGVVLFGRPYNAFAPEANMQIPRKFATRGIPIVSWDALPWPQRTCDSQMNWALGQGILKCADYVAAHPRLFAVYITNFSCGPDSFLVGYLRRLMKDKPSLTLELDSHCADAGINTRIEAFLDIVEKYRTLTPPPPRRSRFVPSAIIFAGGGVRFHHGSGRNLPLKHPDVTFLFPSMGDLSSRMLAATCTGFGYRSAAIPPYNAEALKLGRNVSSGKECLPLQLVAGGLRAWLEKNASPDDRIAYFMPTCGGNCRFTQYSVFLRNMIEDLKLSNVALVSLTNENGYAGFSFSHLYTTIKAFIIADILDDIRNTLAVLATDKTEGMRVFDECFERICAHLRTHRAHGLYAVLEECAATLATIRLRYPVAQARTVSLLGEIFVRRDWFSSQGVIERLAARDIIVRRAHIYEWLDYCDYNVSSGIYDAQFNHAQRLQFKAKRFLMARVERKIKSIFARSGLSTFELTDMKQLIGIGKHFYDVRFTGESILVAGAYFRDILHSVHGAISIGPFACMPTRVNEGVLNAHANRETLARVAPRHGELPSSIPCRLPFLSIEADGNPFSQLIEARIDAFCLQVERVHESLCTAPCPGEGVAALPGAH